MSLKDGSIADHYHSENTIQVTRRIKAKIASSGIRASNPNDSILTEWFDAPALHLNLQRAAYELGRVSEHTAQRIINGLNLSSSSNLLYVGSTFGWTAEHIKRLKPGISVTCVDNAGWVQSVKDEDEAGEIEACMDKDGITGKWRQILMDECLMGPRATEVLLEEDCLSRGSRQRVRNKGGTFSHIVTNVLKWLTDVECVELSEALWDMSVMSAPVSHLVTQYSDQAAERGEPDPVLNWKRLNTTEPVVKRLSDQLWYTTNSWKALLPSDTIIGTGRQVV